MVVYTACTAFGVRAEWRITWKKESKLHGRYHGICRRCKDWFISTPPVGFVEPVGNFAPRDTLRHQAVHLCNTAGAGARDLRHPKPRSQ